jgi:CRISPR system Cascade subunit CasE
MYLSKIEMSISDPGVRAALRDAQKMHRLVSGLYGISRADSSVLYRIKTEGSLVSLYLYADLPVEKENLLPGMKPAGERELSEWLSGMSVGQIWGFDLLTMPYRKVAEEAGKNSRRRVLRTHEERMAWLARKAAQNGFAVVEAQENQAEKLNAVHPAEQGGQLRMDVYRYSGVLHITDSDRFRRALRQGIGPGKAYGMGMLLLMRRS